ncbi:hypothetical protein KKHLCK_10025 [Candidatus Electrothrix laxa]
MSDIELEKFKLDKSDSFELLSYQNRLIQAEHDENSAKVNYLNALTALDSLLGTTLEHWGIDIEDASKVDLP